MADDPAARPPLVDAEASPPRTYGASARKLAGACLVGGLALSLANCGPTRTSGRHPSELKYGVASSPRVIPEGEPIPKGGGRDMVGKPYVVAGRTYVPHPGRGYDREGWASWYGTAFHGRLTANGEIFDRESIAAAHPTLPLPSYVRVTNLVNRRSMVVRVNDRGPYERDRVIDLSERAADALGFHRKGTSRVRVEFVGRASLGGSDDEKLLATLRTDGLPAGLDGSRTQFARAGEGGGRVQAETAKPREVGPRLASAARKADDDDDREVRPVLRGTASSSPVRTDARPVKAALLGGDRRTPDVMPPRRPDLKGTH